MDINSLFTTEGIDWDGLQQAFSADPMQFEILLFKIHYQRKKKISSLAHNNVLKFLALAYLASDDVRYFNELLWFSEPAQGQAAEVKACHQRFEENLDAKGCHKHFGPLHYDAVLAQQQAAQAQAPINPPPLKVCLIGFPPFFGPIIKGLQKDGHQVEQLFLPYHPNKVVRQVLKFKLAVKVFSVLLGNPYPYQTLDFDYRDPQIGDILRAGQYDIAFHKLNVIIKENIFGAFKKGLLNDHWGYLPSLRGKSTIAYSVLLNIPATPTIHFIDQGIDSGAIVGYYPVDLNAAKSLKNMRQRIKQVMPERVIAAIKRAASADFIPIANTPAAGLTFYEIHPWLDQHIAARILSP